MVLTAVAALGLLGLKMQGDGAAIELPRHRVSHEDGRYLLGVARDTWASEADLTHPGTGLPFDSSSRREFTSVSNIGIYLASIVAAKEMKLISASESRRRLDLALNSLEQFRTSFGFQQSWNSVENLEPATHDPWISILDSGNLAAGLLTIVQAEPSLAKRAARLYQAMTWAAFWDPVQRSLLGGYDPSKKEFNRKWLLTSMGTDAQLCQFLAVASGAAPPEYWARLDRSGETREGFSYLKPGWQGGGLFMQFISGLWLDERGTPLGESARNFAAAQIAYAKTIKARAWGWSACQAPDGAYLGWGAIKDDVVTPHACALAIEYFPSEVVANLRELEVLGARSKSFGFFDSFDLKTGRSANDFLLLDQGMLLISLANYLENDCVRRWFQGNEIVKRGREMIVDFKSKGST